MMAFLATVQNGFVYKWRDGALVTPCLHYCSSCECGCSHAAEARTDSKTIAMLHLDKGLSVIES